jgi:hypothetical protein
MSVIALALALAIFAAPVHAAGGLYKWTDDKGITHYSDQMPPDAVNKGTTVFDKQGRPVKKIEAAPTPEQQKAREAEEERTKTQARLREEQTRKDMALLQSYTSEEEIEYSRTRAIGAVNGQIKSAELYSADLTRRQQELESKKAALNGKPLPQAQENELLSLTNEIERQKGLLALKKDEIATINARYDTDKKRWQDIRNDQSRSSAAGLDNTGKLAPGKAAVPSVVTTGPTGQTKTSSAAPK